MRSEFLMQTTQPKTDSKPKEPPTSKEKPKEKPKVPAQRPVLGKKMWNPNAPTTYPN